ncbi:hypothetical protein LI82_01005 [Methanococcoides methylutens]|uniref:Uncharacterized protein n=1 Tax=Methanococcoides methylutens TaxID=2226 RepID=A0A099T6M5_METMT|nr:hypothetical protein [Methanococcoides methylutens]KGK99808.1 hypothetical protein LI82_01005 [Methanococcoides methylutens]
MAIDAIDAILTPKILEMSTEMTSMYTLTDVVFDVVAYPVMAILALMIYLEIAKLYSISQYEGLKHFKNTFFFFGVGNLAILTMMISMVIAKFSLEVGTLFFLFVGIPALLLAGCSFWIANTELLYTITWRFFDNISTKRRYKSMFFLALMAFVLIDVIAYGVISEYYGLTSTIMYKGSIFILILLLIRSNLRSSGRIGSIKHPYYLGLIIIFTLNFLGTFSDLISEDTIAGIIINGLTIVAYFIILKGIRKWTRILTI